MPFLKIFLTIKSVKNLFASLFILLSIFIFSSISSATEATYEQHIAKGISSLETNNYKDAINEFRAALIEKPNDATTTLYLGIALNRSGDKEAETILKKALSMNPEEPRTNLELGIYYFNRTIYDEASDYFENTIKVAPATEFSARAEEYLKVIKQRGTVKRWILNISAGGQYDSNVVLNPDNSPLPQGISRKSDWRTIVYLKGRYNIITKEKLEGFISYSLYQSLHMKLSDFNVTQNLLELKGAYTISPTLNLKGIYSFEYVHVGWEKYDYAHSLSPSLIISEGKGFSTIIEYKYRKNHFMDSDLFVSNSERTGSNNLIGITQNIPIGTFLSASIGYSHDEDSTRKDYWDYQGDKGTAGLRWSLPKNILLDLAGEYYKKDYKGINPLSSEKREDKAFTTTILATKALSERYSITAGQLYTRNKSNIGAYDYKRGITSLFLNTRF